jgi:hypothetical protein
MEISGDYHPRSWGLSGVGSKRNSLVEFGPEHRVKGKSVNMSSICEFQKTRSQSNYKENNLGPKL